MCTAGYLLDRGRRLPSALWLVFVVAAARLPAETVRLTFETGAYAVQDDGSGFQTLTCEGCALRGAPGSPLLPERTVNVLLPPDVDWNSLAVFVSESATEDLPGSYLLAPAAPDAARVDGNLVLDWGDAGTIVDGLDLGVYANDAFLPAAPAALLPYSRLRKWRFTRLRFSPVQYNPAQGRVRICTRAVVDVSFERARERTSAAFGPDTAVDRLAPELFDNYTDGRAWYEARVGLNGDLPSASYDYVIITTTAILSGSTRLAAFVAHKTALGHSVLVIDETDFGALTGQAPDHKAEKIRQWLINHYAAYGIEYVLLIGDPSPYESGEGDIPMKLCWPRRGAGSYEDSPTDAFYADLTGNWDLDGDGYYGEWSDYTGSGGVDFTMEVWVGRIPVYGSDYTALDGILQKIIDYETAGAVSWRDNVLLPMSFSAAGYDGAPLAEQMRDDYLTARSYASWRQYQQGGACSGADSVYPSEEELRGGTVVRDRWTASAYGLVCWWGHGSTSSAVVGYDGCWDGTLFSNTQAPALDDDHPAFTFQCSCNNAWPESSANLAYAILANGGIGAAAATRVSWFNTGVGYGMFDGSSVNAGIGYEFCERLTDDAPAGRALLEGKLAVVPDIATRDTRLMNQYDFNLYGDPATGLASSGSASPPRGMLYRFR
ncbi:MAG: hypothetical protein JW951_04680 [Lentisphaerae bacterium]|nr:hypothetical protein [Lentisphaerota bacterium]